MKALVFGVVLLAAISGCDGGNQLCNCPAAISSLSLPADISARVTSATGDTCTAILDAPAALITLTSSGHHPCHVRIQLDDGRAEETTATFTPLGGCCASLYTVQGSAFSPTDGGAG